MDVAPNAVMFSRREMLPMKLLLPFAALVWPTVALAGEPGGHVDPVGHVALSLVVILIVAKLSGDLAVRSG